jgi:hypothetical protein
VQCKFAKNLRMLTIRFPMQDVISGFAMVMTELGL